MVQGIVNYCSISRVRLLESKHYCEETKKFKIKEYKDQLKIKMDDEEENIQGMNRIPVKDDDGKTLKFLFGSSKYKNIQTLGIQESPDNVPTGLMSRSISVFLQEGLCDKAKPGDKIQVIGILKPRSFMTTLNTGTFNPILLAYQVHSLTKEKVEQEFTPKEMQ